MRVYIDQTTFPSFITLTLTLISSLLLLLTRSHSLSLLPLISISLTLSLVAKASTILYPVEYTSTPTLAPVSHSTHRHSFTRFNPPPNQSNSIFSSLSQTTTTHTSTRLYYHNVVPNHSRTTPLGFRRRWISARTSSCQTRSTRRKRNSIKHCSCPHLQQCPPPIPSSTILKSEIRSTRSRRVC